MIDHVEGVLEVREDLLDLYVLRLELDLILEVVFEFLLSLMEFSQLNQVVETKDRPMHIMESFLEVLQLLESQDH
jgi:hypothetical protein